jgi:uncharacterized protein with von Willebrand factor type A (vWA) domain
MRELDAPYDRLAELPPGLWLPGLVTAVGGTAQRLADLAPWLAALEAGALPPDHLHWGDRVALPAMRAAIGELGLPPLCRGVPALAQQVLRTMLWHLDRLIDRAVGVAQEDALTDAVQGFREQWVLQLHGLEERLVLLQSLADLSQLSWDELQGLLNAREWRQAEHLGALLAQLQPLVDLIRTLGRTEHLPQGDPARSAVPARGRALLPLRERETRLPDAPGELLGIRHSDRIERMLGSEALQIRHPVLHKLWRARLAESRLLTYQSEAVLRELVPDLQARPQRAAAERPEPLARGPMILCIDTSGSMRGAPENIAKAVVLEAARTAQREQRGCVLMAFGAAGEVVERELQGGAPGLHALLELLGQGFGGGTDVATPIEHAMARVRTRQWRSADLLLVSDGEFGCTPATLTGLDAARAELDLRVQGVLVGDRETMGLLEVCDAIHSVRDWRRFEGAVPQRHGFVPVHTPSLTALYFPNALSERAARHQRGLQS